MTALERVQELAGFYRELEAIRHNERHTVYRIATIGRQAVSLVQEWPDAEWPAFPRAPQGPTLTKQWVLTNLQEGIAEARSYRYAEHDTSWMEVLRPIHGALEIFYRLLYRPAGR